MMKATLTPAQVATLAFLSTSDVAPETRQLAFRDIIAATKVKFGIPAEHKLRTGSENHYDNDYGTLYRKKTGKAYELDPVTGRWVGAVPTPAAVPEPVLRWFPLDANQTVDEIVDANYYEDGQVYPSGTPVGNEFRVEGYKAQHFDMGDGAIVLWLGFEEADL